MKNVLVTGANGFVGRDLCKKLLSENINVRGTVRPEKAHLLPKGVEARHIESIDGGIDWENTLDGVDTGHVLSGCDDRINKITTLPALCIRRD